MAAISTWREGGEGGRKEGGERRREGREGGREGGEERKRGREEARRRGEEERRRGGEEEKVLGQKSNNPNLKGGEQLTNLKSRKNNCKTAFLR